MKHRLLLSAQNWWDAQRFDQAVWQVDAWRDQKVRHIHLHVAKALGKVIAMLEDEVPTTPGKLPRARVRDEVLPDVAIYRSQLINLLPDGWLLPPHVGIQENTPQDEPLWGVVCCLSRASAQLAAYLEPREHGVASPDSHLKTAIENLHASAEALATFFGVDLTRAHLARLEALLEAPIPTSLVEAEETAP